MIDFIIAITKMNIKTFDTNIILVIHPGLHCPVSIPVFIATAALLSHTPYHITQLSPPPPRKSVCLLSRLPGSSFLLCVSQRHVTGKFGMWRKFQFRPPVKILTRPEILIQRYYFRCVLASLYEGLSVHQSVHWSVCSLVRPSVGPSVCWSVPTLVCPSGSHPFL